MFPKTVSLKGILKFSKRNFVSLLLKRFPYFLLTLPVGFVYFVNPINAETEAIRSVKMERRKKHHFHI